MDKIESFKQICSTYALMPYELGSVISDSHFLVEEDGREVVNQSLDLLQDAFLNSLPKYLK